MSLKLKNAIKILLNFSAFLFTVEVDAKCGSEF
jgi:hypothetical protein